jgi:hypothetical protein
MKPPLPSTAKDCGFRIGCPDGKTWNTKVAQKCVEALAKADCSGINMSPVPVVPDVCKMNCQ